MLEIWDNLLLLSNGRVVYAGSIKELETYLKRKGYHIPQSSSVNPVEFALELLAIPLHSQTLLDYWSENPQILINSVEFPPNRRSQSNSPFLHHVAVLSYRHFMHQWKSIHGVSAMAVRNIVGGLIFGMLYFRNGRYLENQKNIIDIDTRYFTAYCANMQSLQFTSVIFLVAINAIAVPSMNSASILFRREQVRNFSLLFLNPS